MRPLTVPLDEIARDNDDVGTQAKALGTIIAAGLPVPPGFVVVAEAWLAFADAASLAPLITEMRDTSDDDVRLLELAAAVRARILATPLPPAIDYALHDAIGAIGGGPVTVRVDGDAQMNVAAADIGDAVKRAWGSAFSEPEVMTRAKRGIDPHEVRVAVVVEQRVQADVEGELYTVDPLGGDDRLVIDAHVRRGHASHLVIDKRTLRVVAPAGTSTGTGAAVAAVPPDALRALVKLAVDVERLLKAPQDILWALAGGRVMLLDATPMPGRTAAARADHDDESRALGGVTLALMRELAPRRPYPIDTSGYGKALLEGLATELGAPFGVRIPGVDELFPRDAGVVVHMARKRRQPSLRMVWRPCLSLWKHRDDDPSDVHADDAVDDVIADVRARVRVLASQDLSRLSHEELFAFLGDADHLGPRVAAARKKYFPRALKDTAVLWLMLSSVGAAHRLPELVDNGLTFGRGAADRALDDLAAMVRSDDDLARVFKNNDAHTVVSALAQHGAGRDFLTAFRAFLEEHGHKGTGGLLLASQPAWENAPAVPLAIVKERALLHAPSSTPTMPATASSPPSAHADAVADELVRTTKLGTRPLEKRFRRALEGARRLPRLHEDTRDLVGIAHPVVHDILLELGGRLVHQGALDDAEQIFHLTMDEVKAAFAPFADVEFTRTLAEARARKRAVVEAAHPWGT